MDVDSRTGKRKEENRMHRVSSLLLFATLGMPAAMAQTSSEGTIQALLSEVRQLRLALERSAVVAPKIQLTLQRLQLQHDAVTRASRDLEGIRNQLSRMTGEERDLITHIKVMEASLVSEQDASKRKGLEDETKRVKLRLEELGVRSQQENLALRGRESELSSRMQTEQAKLDQLSDRLNALEQMLDAPQPKQP